METTSSVFPAKTSDRRVRQVLHALSEEPSLRTGTLARMVGLSRSRLKDLFRQETGKSIGEYSLELRLQRAQELLVTTYLSIKEVRNRSDIPDGTNFARAFKRRFRTSPSEYRRRFFRSQFDQQIVTSTNTGPLQQSRAFASTAPAPKKDTVR